MKILSLNVNGLRAFYNRGGTEGGLLQSLLDSQDPDILLFQEIKCNPETYKYWLGEWENEYQLAAFHNQFQDSYAGVGAMVKKGIDARFFTKTLIINNYDTGRIMRIDLKDKIILGVYVLNSGDKDDLRKEWNEKFLQYVEFLKQDKPVIILGDLNAVSSEQDCWAYEQYFDEMPGVKEYEINWLHDLLKLGFIDSFAQTHDEETWKYSWFSYRGDSRYSNKGFRLDYALVDEKLKKKIKSCEILGSACEYSDHSPVLLEIK